MSGTTNQRLIPANTTLLQPGSRFFRLADALNYAAQATQAVHTTAVTTVTTASLQTQITSLQSQIDSLNARLAAAHIP